MAQSFENTLAEMLEKEELIGDLDSPVICGVQCCDGYVLGLESGMVVLITTGPEMDIEVFVSESGGHSAEVNCLVLIPDGKRVASGSADNSVRVWSLSEKKEEFKFEGHALEVTCLAVTPDGLRVISGSRDETVRVWNLEERVEEIVFEGHSDEVTCVAVTPDGYRVVSGSMDETVRVWNLADEEEEHKFEGHSDYVTCLAVTSDSIKVLSGSDDNTVRLWNLSEKREETTFEGHTSAVACLAVFPGDLHFVSGSADNTVRVWNLVDKWEEYKLEGHCAAVACLAVISDCMRVISGSADNTVRVWNLAERKEEIGFEGHSKAVSCLAVTADGTKLVSGSTDKTVRVWNLAEKQGEIKLEGHLDEVRCLAVTPAGDKIVSGSLDRTVRTWSISEKRQESKFEGHSNTVNCLAVTPDGMRVVSGSADNTVRIWNLVEQREEPEFDRHTDTVWYLAVTPDGSRVVSGSKDHSVRVWCIESKKEEAKLNWEVTCLAVTPEGNRLVSGSMDGKLRVWNLLEKKEETLFEGHSGPVWCLAVTSTILVSGSADKTVRVWNLARKTEDIKLEGHSGWVNCLAITPDGSRVVSGSKYDNTVRVWNLIDKTEELKYEGRFDRVNCLAVTPDGSRLVIGWSSHITVLAPQYYFPFHIPETCPDDLRVWIKRFRTGECSTLDLARSCYPKCFNSLHIFAFYNRSESLAACLLRDVPILRGEFGSPLTLALYRSSTSCVDAILQYFLMFFKQPRRDLLNFTKIEAITEDLPELLGCHSEFLRAFFEIMMQKPIFPLPEFINPILPLPITIYHPTRSIDFSHFHDASGQKDNVLVNFLMSVPRWDFTAGSEQSLKLLKAFSACPKSHVLATPFVSAVIEEKWKRFYWWTLFLTCAYGLLLVALCFVLFLERCEFIVAFCILNAFFVQYEIAQMLADGRAYFLDTMNAIDVVRGVLCAAWSVQILFTQQHKYFTLAVVAFCFLRGFTYFRSFKMTRIFVFTTLAVVREMYSFLIILWYSVFAFGILNGVMLQTDALTSAWKEGFNLLMGNVDNSSYGFVEWAVFASANVTNIVIMLNLLVSILGEAYAKTQMSVREHDLHLQLDLIIEYESMMFWRKHTTSVSTALVTCRLAETNEGEEWQGQILQITNNIKSTIRETNQKLITLDEQTGNRLKAVETRLDKRLDALDEQVRKLGDAEQQYHHKVEERLISIEEQLSAILSFVSSRS